jgi:hypothetical protein
MNDFCAVSANGVVVGLGRALTSCAMVVWLVAPTVSCVTAGGDDVGQNPSLLGTASMALLASFPS